MDAIRVSVGGSRGRMSRCLSDCIQKDPTLSLVARTDHCDVFIDFTHPDALLEHLSLCSHQRCPMVIGVTGFSDQQKENIRKASTKIPIVLSPNMSIGANVSFKVLDMVARALGPDSQVAIHDIHHKHKKDAPSGTALKMGDIISAAFRKPLKGSDICFASSRLGECMGEHSVLFALPGEQLEIKHKVDDRFIFARGAVSAAKWVTRQPPGLYDMQDVLGLKSFRY